MIAESNSGKSTTLSFIAGELNNTDVHKFKLSKKYKLQKVNNLDEAEMDIKYCYETSKN